MKRLSLLTLILMLCLALAACQTQPPASTDTPDAAESDASETPAPAEPLKLSELNVEFVVDGRDPDRLLALRSDFPWAMRDALEKQSVTADEIVVTFGTSGEATEAALRSGAIQVAFLSAEDYFPYRSGQIVAVEQGTEPDLALGLIVSAVSDDPDADERFASSLRLALGELTTALAPYTGEAAQGVYTYDTELIEQLGALYESEAAAHEH